MTGGTAHTEDGHDAASRLAALLERHREPILRFVRREGEGLLRFETEEDLVQGISLRALEVADHFEFRGEREFLAWVGKVARQHISHRHRFWTAVRRNPGKVERLSQLVTAGVGVLVPPAARAPGPRTVAGRREETTLLLRALAILPSRDQQLLRWSLEAVDDATVAANLGISVAAAERARRRAVERLRIAHRALSQGLRRNRRGTTRTGSGSRGTGAIQS